jgi:4-hydroxy-3-methylbut-2-enyl diphosphate reductase
VEINIAKTSGFCFGVDRAINIVDDLLCQDKNVCTLGPIIHNPQVIDSLSRRGVKIVNHPSEISADDNVLVIRSHGITKSALEYIELKNIRYVDATCPFVKKIHRIVAEQSKEKAVLLAAGDELHPEMIGIRSCFNKKSHVFGSLEKLKKLVEKNPYLKKESTLVIAQTTFSTSEWAKCTNFINSLFTNATIFDTICNTTGLRQKEAKLLSKTSDLMIVIGGKYSSNTLKLYNICKKNVDTILVERPEDLPPNLSKRYGKIGVTAGASTPINFVKRICDSIK